MSGVKKFSIILGLLVLLALLIGAGFYYFRIRTASKISVVSEISGISAKLNRTDELEKYVNSLQFFTKNGVRLRNGEHLQVSVSRLVIHLTDEEYNFDKFVDENKQYLTSTNEEFVKSTLHLYIGLNPKVYFENVTDNFKAERAVTSQVGLSLFALTKPSEYAQIQTLSRNTMPPNLIIFLDESKRLGQFIKLSEL